jgi:hypothetical protein
MAFQRGADEVAASAVVCPLSPARRSFICQRTLLAPLGWNARKRERVQCSSLVDWPVYPRLRRARLSALPGGGAFGCGLGFGAVAGSSFASAERSGSRRGACGNRSSSMARRTVAVTAASSPSVRSIVGTALARLPPAEPIADP